jgi:tRNA (guanine37-N1)-methyltransferase
LAARLQIDILTLFPDMFAEVFDLGVLGRAREAGIVEIGTHDIREFTHDRHRTADDYAFGGGPGMVMKPEPIADAIESVRRAVSRIVLLSPQGAPFDHAAAARLANQTHLVLLCGRYEGVDERVRQRLVDEEISIGDYVLTGGEIPAMVITDAVVRLVPGVVGKAESVSAESHVAGLLEHPHFTRPRDFAGMSVPEVLISGDHAAIEGWRRRESLRRTLLRRPDLLRQQHLSPEERAWLEAEEPGPAAAFFDSSGGDCTADSS